MFTQAVIISVISVLITEAQVIPDVHIKRSEGVQSMGATVIYGHEDMNKINEVVEEREKISYNKAKKTEYEASVKPLRSQDVKCLMSVDNYCSKEMQEMKSILLKSVKDDCADCSLQQKLEAGKVMASMITHDPVAWKIFLTRYGELPRVQAIFG